MTTKTLDKPIQGTVENHIKEVCIHHWKIEPPENPVSMGVCLKCGLTQEFNNYTLYSPWDSVSASSQKNDLGMNINTDLNEDWD
jgi:hypothetical protein